MAAKRGKNLKRKGKTTLDPERKLTIEFLPVDVPLHYVDNVNVIHTATEFTIAFMQSQPPLIASESELEQLTVVKSKCVARIIVTPPKWGVILRALMENYKIYLEQYMQP